MHTFIIEIFTSKNTSFQSTIEAKNFQSAINKSRKSNNCFYDKIIIHDSSYGYHSSNNDFVALEHGTITEASRTPLFNL